MARILARGTLRTRLTAWYVILLGVTSLLFSGYLYLRLEGSLLEQTDAALQAAASQAVAIVDESHGSPVNGSQPGSEGNHGPG